jgi:predicted DNA-binding transcriptional regulator AlpA
MNDPRPTPAILALPPSACPPDLLATAGPAPNPATDVGASRRGKPAGPGGPPIEETGVGRLALRLEEIATALGVSRRAIERERSAGRFPKPDRVIGRMPLWRVETIRAWIGGAGR